MKKAEIHFRNWRENLKERLPKFFDRGFLNDSVIQLMSIAALVILIAAWIIAVIRFKPSDFDIPLKYDSFLGVTRLGRWYELYKIPLFAATSFLINLALANKIYKKDKMIGYILIGANIFICIIAIIIIINFSILGF